MFTKFPTYLEASEGHRPFVAFVGVQPRDIEGVTVSTAKEIWHEGRWQAGAVVVFRADGYVWLPADADDAMVRKNLERKVQPTQSPFELLPSPASATTARREAQEALPVGDGKWPRTPKGEKYVRAKYTQEIAVTNGRDRITAVSRERLAVWSHQSGGMEGIEGYRSEVYRHVRDSSKAESYVANLGVLNSFGHIQYNRGWTRTYPDGTRFDDVLTNEKTGKMFEHRVAFKDRGVWTRKVIFSDVEQRPAGYEGLKQSCASCHDEQAPGTGGYATGLLPGADGVYSDPIHALERTDP